MTKQCWPSDWQRLLSDQRNSSDHTKLTTKCATTFNSISSQRYGWKQRDTSEHALLSNYPCRDIATQFPCSICFLRFFYHTNQLFQKVYWSIPFSKTLTKMTHPWNHKYEFRFFIKADNVKFVFKKERKWLSRFKLKARWEIHFEVKPKMGILF